MVTCVNLFGTMPPANTQSDNKMMRALVAFALKEEFAPWRRKHRFRRVANSSYSVSVASLGSIEVHVALVGAGAHNADHVHDLTARLQPSVGVVTGVAAGLKPEWRSGDIVVAHSVCGSSGDAKLSSDPTLIDLAVQCGAKPAPSLITLPRIARTIDEKVNLATVADIADMESLTVMKQWSACGIPALALRVVLDPVDMPMTCDFEAAMGADGQMRIGRLLGQLARRPQLLPDFLRFARQSRRALAILACFLDRFFDRLERHRRSYMSLGPHTQRNVVQE